jgi:hypothetical protein
MSVAIRRPAGVRGNPRRAHCLLHPGGTMLVLALIAGFYLLTFGIIAASMRNAVDGYQDEEGFHFNRRNNRTDDKDFQNYLSRLAELEAKEKRETRGVWRFGM